MQDLMRISSDFLTNCVFKLHLFQRELCKGDNSMMINLSLDISKDSLQDDVALFLNV